MYSDFHGFYDFLDMSRRSGLLPIEIMEIIENLQ